MSPLTISQIHALPHTLLQSKPSKSRGMSVQLFSACDSARRERFRISVPRRPLTAEERRPKAAAGRRSAAAALAVGAVVSLLGSPERASPAEEEFVKKTVSSHDIVIFSKTYCPYCKTAKSVFKEMNMVPYVVELDEREDGQDLQDALAKLVGRRTVPQVFIKGKHLGGSDDTVEAYESGKLAKLLRIGSNDEL